MLYKLYLIIHCTHTHTLNFILNQLFWKKYMYKIMFMTSCRYSTIYGVASTWGCASKPPLTIYRIINISICPAEIDRLCTVCTWQSVRDSNVWCNGHKKAPPISRWCLSKTVKCSLIYMLHIFGAFLLHCYVTGLFRMSLNIIRLVSP